MTVQEKHMAQKILKLEEELQTARDGLNEMSMAVDAVMISTALGYGARLPDGGMVLTVDRPAVVLTDKFIVQSKYDKRGHLRVEVWKKDV